MRYAVPRIHRALVPRKRLRELMQDWRNRRIIGVVAPAGYGKTTLVAEWLHAMPTADRPRTAWWSLDPTDDAPDVFLRRLLTALRTTVDDPARIDELIAAAAAGQAAPHHIAQMLADLLENAPPLVLVLDDVHLLGTPDVHGLMQTLVDQAPPALHLVFLSRTTLPLTLIRHRLSDALLEFSIRDLAFDHHEFEEFVHGSSLASCPPQILADIERRTEGWIAGLRMFALAGERQTPLLAASTFLPEFLQHEILRRLPRDLVDLLIHSSPLPWLDAATLAATLDISRQAAEAALHRILHTDLLAQTFALSPESTDLAVRLHPLLREHLLARLHRTIPSADVRLLQRRAADALDAEGDVDAALALLTDDAPAAARLLARRSRTALRRNERVMLRRWLQLIPDAELHAQPQLALDAAWLSYMADAADQPAHIAAAHAAIHAVTDTPRCVHDEWLTELHCLEGLQAFFDQRREDAHASYTNACATPHAVDGFAEAVRLELFANLSQFTSPEESLRALQQSSAILRSLGFITQAIESMLFRALLIWLHADLPRALLTVQEAAAITDVERLAFHTSTTYLHNIRGELLYYMDRIPEARESLLRSLQMSTAIGEPQSTDYWSRMFLQLCDLADFGTLDIDDEEDARLWLDGHRLFYPSIYMRNAWLRIRRDAVLGRLDRIRTTLQSLDVTPDDLKPDMHESYWLAILNGGIYVADDPTALEAPLLRLVDLLHDRKRFWWAVHARTLLAVLYVRTGRVAEARAQITELLPILEHNRCPRFLLEYSDLLPLIAMDSSPFAQAMLQRIPPGASHGLRPYNLSNREIEVLHMLVAGRSTKEICSAKHIALATLRIHTNSIYRKLGVHSRAEAVRVARTVGIGE